MEALSAIAAVATILMGALAVEEAVRRWRRGSLSKNSDKRADKKEKR